MSIRPISQSRIDWLQALLFAAVVALFLQLFPSVWWALLARLNPYGWTRAVWFTLNATILLGLFALRSGIKVKDLLASSPITKQCQHDSFEVDDRAQKDAEWCKRARERLPWH